jgi:transketolase
MSTDTEDGYAELRGHARSIRERILRAIHHVGSGHAGTSLSAVEIMVSLYYKHLAYRPTQPTWPERDIFILGKGHGAPVLYSTLAELGVIPETEMYTLRRFGSRLQGHPSEHSLAAVEVSVGSLGQALSIALGLCLGMRLDESERRVWVLQGDGELQEGQVWEAAMAASGRKCSNLIAIVDENGLQNDGPTDSIVPLGDLEAKWRAFGWRAYTVDGHDLAELDRAFAACRRPSEQPSVVIARTIKGRGVSYMENVVKWHHHPINDEELTQALSDLKGGGDARGN